MELSNKDFFADKAKGCFLGALIGNALGAYLDKQLKPSAKDIEASLKFPAGGIHKVGSGQITDDGELQMSLAIGLVEGKGQLNLYTIADAYGQWLSTKPLNVGETLKAAIAKANPMKEHSLELVNVFFLKQFYQKMRKNSIARSMDSQSNGALMRIAPLCVWCSQLTLEENCQAIKEVLINLNTNIFFEKETTLTHPNETVIQVNQFYSIAISHLLKNDNDRKGAFEAAKEYMKKIANKDLIQWITEIEQNKECEKTKNLGYVKIPFFHAFRFLLKGLNFEEALKATLAEGGDTDTNCSVVGGLIGAAEGAKTFPEKLVAPVMSWKMKKGDYKRPENLNPGKHFEEIMAKLLECIPKKLEVTVTSNKEKKTK